MASHGDKQGPANAEARMSVATVAESSRQNQSQPVLSGPIPGESKQLPVSIAQLVQLAFTLRELRDLR